MGKGGQSNYILLAPSLILFFEKKTDVFLYIFLFCFGLEMEKK